TPVPGQAGRPAILLVHQHDVVGIAEAGEREHVRIRVGGAVDADVALHDGVVRQDAEAAVAEEVLATDLPAVQRGGTLVDRDGHVYSVQRVRVRAGDAVPRLHAGDLGRAAVVRTRATGRGFVPQHGQCGEQRRVVAIAGRGRVVAGRGDLQLAGVAVQERQGRLRVGTGGRVGDSVQVLLPDTVADEVLDPLVPVGHRNIAGGREVPLQADVHVVGLERQQPGVLATTRSAVLLA